MGADRGWFWLNSRQRERWRSRNPARFPREESHSRETSNEEVSINLPVCPYSVELDAEAPSTGKSLQRPR